jgi:signal transduction histidine kinase
MKRFVFYRISQGYYVYLPSFDCPGSGTDAMHILTHESLPFDHNGQTIKPANLSEAVKSVCGGADRSQTVVSGPEDHYIAIAPAPLFLARRSHYARKVQQFALLDIEYFRMQTRDRLIKELFSPGADVQAWINAFTRYVFHDAFTFWMHNPETDVFCLIASSASVPYNVITRADASTLHGFLDANVPYDSRQPKRDVVNSPFTSKFCTLNRLRIDFGGSLPEKAVLNLYSRFPNFGLRDSTRAMIVNALRGQYAQHQYERQSALGRVEAMLNSYRLGESKSLLYELTRMVCEEFSFEACSVFTLAPEGKSLQLVALSDIAHTGEPTEPVVYDLSKDSLTALVYNTGKPVYSYDVSRDPRNSHTFAEQRSLPDKCWMGLPLVCDQRALGVFRLSNKYSTTQDGKRHPENFGPSDISSLKTICATVGNILHAERDYTLVTTRAREVQKLYDHVRSRLDNLDTEQRVFIHEVRTPISTFNMAPLTIADLLSIKPLTDEILAKARLMLDDIMVMGERLEYIANLRYGSGLLKNLKCERLTVLHDIVYPVRNITGRYIKKQRGLTIRFESAAMEGCVVYGDKRLLNIALNALLDNAAKYTLPDETEITIKGSLDMAARKVRLSVINQGYPIYDHEKDLIFVKGERGVEAKNQKTDGSGIGLPFARDVMEALGGQLVLESLKSPVVFTMLIPTEPPVKGASNGKDLNS